LLKLKIEARFIFLLYEVLFQIASVTDEGLAFEHITFYS